MIQALVKKGKVLAEEVPEPVVSKGALLIKVVNSCISAGTELSGVSASGKSLIARAFEQPEKIKKAIDMLKSDGIALAYRRIMGELDAGKPTGYSLSGVVIAVGEGVNGFEVGERVAAAGGGVASHAEYVDVPVNLVVKIPEGVGFPEASTVALGAIAMQGVRRADLKLGEFCVVFGTGILGLLTIQILRATGIRVAAVDLDKKRLEIAAEMGAEIILNPSEGNPVKSVTQWAEGHGADAVIFTAATASSEPLSQSFQMCRRKGRVVLVGVAGMEIQRQDIYAKELDFLVSTSYGPGRYDKNYEQTGLDYPLAYVRWTENRNMREYLRLLGQKKIQLQGMIDQLFPVENVEKAFQALRQSENKPLIVLLDYGMPETAKLHEYQSHGRKTILNTLPVKRELINVALVGTGNFATATHLPNLQKLKGKYRLFAVMNRTGHKGKAIADQYGAAYATTNYSDILQDENVDLVLICTRHDSHADLALQALRAGKNVFVEKPLATNHAELEAIKAFFEEEGSVAKPVFFVGFNRRFSALSQEIKKHTDKRINPLFVRYRMNAGYVPPDHWVHESGGRMVGEACHIVDLMNFLIGERIASIHTESLSPKTAAINASDNKALILKYRDGSICEIAYFATGSKQFPKEYMEVHFDEKTIVVDDYKSLKGYGVRIQENATRASQKGHLEELEALYKTLKRNTPSWPIELWDMVQTTEITFMMSAE